MKFTFSKKMAVFILMPVVLVLVVMTYFSYSKARVTLSDTIDKQLGNMVKIQGEALFSNLMVYRAITQEVCRITQF